MTMKLKLSKVVKSLISAILMMCLISIFPMQSVNAESGFENNLDSSAKVMAVNDNMLRIVENGETSDIIVRDSRIEIVENGILKQYFQVSNQGIYSSATDTIIPFDELEGSGNQTNILKAPPVQDGASKKIEVSFYKIKKALKNEATVAGIAGVLIAVLVAKGFECPAMLGVVISILSSMPNLIADTMKGSKTHGLRVKIKSYFRQVKGEKRLVWKITGIVKY